MMKKLASMSIHLDPIDHYFNVRGWNPNANTKLNAIYDSAIPLFLDLLDKYNIKATFFVVGKDLKIQRNRKTVKLIKSKGHEIANHTMNHLQPFTSLSKNQKQIEIENGDKIISDVTGSKVSGFCTPGWDIDIETINLLENYGYVYDSSVFPSYYIPLLKSISYLKDRRMGAKGFGKPIFICIAPRRPYYPSEKAIWKKGKRKILEIPTCVLPIIRFPFWGTLNFIYGIRGFNLNFQLANLSRIPIVYVLHGLDLVDFYAHINDYRLKVKPGITLPLSEKILIYDEVFKTFVKYYSLHPLIKLASRFSNKE